MANAEYQNGRWVLFQDGNPLVPMSTDELTLDGDNDLTVGNSIPNGTTISGFSGNDTYVISTDLENDISIRDAIGSNTIQFANDVTIISVTQIHLFPRGPVVGLEIELGNTNPATGDNAIISVQDLGNIRFQIDGVDRATNAPDGSDDDSGDNADLVDNSDGMDDVLNAAAFFGRYEGGFASNNTPPDIIIPVGGRTIESPEITDPNTPIVPIVTFTATDEGDTVTWSLENSGDAALFSIDEGTGALTWVNRPDYEDSELVSAVNGNKDFVVTVIATDSSRVSDSEEFTIRLTNVFENTAPEIVNPDDAALRLADGATITVLTPEGRDEVIDLAATDIDSDQRYWEFTGGDTAEFSIDEDTGVITWATTPDYEHERFTRPTNPDDREFTLEVTVFDRPAASRGVNTGSATVNITIMLTDINEVPVISTTAADGMVTVRTNGEMIDVGSPENQTDVITLSVSDEDDGDVVTWVLTGDDEALFQIDQGSGAVTWRAEPDHETLTSVAGTSVFHVIATASDDDAPAASTSVTLNIRLDDANDAPVPVRAALAANADEAVVLDTTHLLTTDVDEDGADVLTYTINVLASTGVLEVSRDDGATWTALGVNGEFTQADVNAGLVRFVADSSATGTDPWFELSVADGGENEVAAINNIILYADIRVDKAITDIDMANTADARGQTAPQNIETGDGHDTIYGGGGSDRIDGGLGDDTITLGNGEEADGTARADDRGDEVIYRFGAGGVAEDGGDGITRFTRGEDKLVFTEFRASSSEALTLGEFFTSVRAGDTAEYRAGSNYVTGDLQEDLFILTPNFELDENDVFFITGITFNFRDVGLVDGNTKLAGGLLSITFDTPLTWDAFSAIVTDETTPIESVIDYNVFAFKDPASILRILGEDSFEFRPVVAPANEAPVFASATAAVDFIESGDVNDAEGSRGSAVLVHTATATDADSDPIGYTIVSVTRTTDSVDVTADNILGIENGELYFRQAQDYEAAGGIPAYEVVVRADDNNGGTADQTVTISVTNDVADDTPVNNAPVFASATAAVDFIESGDVNDAEGSRGSAVLVHTATATDADSDPIGYTIVSVTRTTDSVDVTADNILGIENGELYFRQAQDYEAAGGIPAYEVVVRADDNNGGTADQTVTISVTNDVADDTPVNNAPVFASATAAVDFIESGDVNDAEGSRGSAVLVHTATATDADSDPIGYTIVSVTRTTDSVDVTADNILGIENGELYFRQAQDYEAAGGIPAYEVVVRADDNNGGTADQTVTISVTNDVADDTPVNNAPVFASATAAVDFIESGDVNDAEGSRGSAVLVHTAAATDADSDPIGYTIVSVTRTTDSVDVTADNILGIENGELYFRQAQDYEAAGGIPAYEVVVRADDNNGGTADQTVTISVTNDVADDTPVNNAPVFASATAAVDFIESGDVNDAEGSRGSAVLVHTATATDADSDPIGYTIVSVTRTTDSVDVTADNILGIENGELYFRQAQDYEAAGGIPAYEVVVRADDNNGGTADQTVTISVTNDVADDTPVNNAPVFASATAAVDFIESGDVNDAEGSRGSAVLVHTATATDADSDPIGYTIVSVTRTTDSVDVTADNILGIENGELYFRQAQDYEAAGGIPAYEVVVRADDNNGGTADQTVTISVTNDVADDTPVNNAPVFASATAAVDFIESGDVNDAEGSRGSAVLVHTAAATDADSDPIGYTIVSVTRTTDSVDVTADNILGIENGELYFRQAQDYEAAGGIPAYEVVVRADDNNGGTADQTVTISVTNDVADDTPVNNAPVFASATAAVDFIESGDVNDAEGSRGSAVLVHTATATDADSDPIGYTIVSVTRTTDSVDVTADNILGIENGELYFRQAQDYEAAGGIPAYEVVVRADDNNGGTADQTVTISVTNDVADDTPVNNAPVFASATAAVDFIESGDVNDAEGSRGSAVLVHTATATDADSDPIGYTIVSVTRTTDSVDVTADNILGIENGELYFRQAQDYEAAGGIPAYEVVVRADDNNGGTADQTVTISVTNDVADDTPVNNAPVFASATAAVDFIESGDVNDAEGSRGSAVLVHTAAATDADSDPIGYTIVSVTRTTDSVDVTADNILGIENGELYFRQAQDYEAAGGIPAYEVVVRADDNNGGTADQTVTISVTNDVADDTPVNNAPVFASATAAVDFIESGDVNDAEGSRGSAVLVHTATATDADSDPIGYTIVSVTRTTDSVDVTADNILGIENGELYFRQAQDYEAAGGIPAYEVVVRADDNNGGTADQTVTISVTNDVADDTPVNNAPVFASATAAVDFIESGDVNDAEGSRGSAVLVHTATATDADSDPIGYTIVSVTRTTDSVDVTADNILGIENGELYFRQAQDYEAAGGIPAYEVVVRADDNNGGTADQTVTISVTNDVADDTDTDATAVGAITGTVGLGETLTAPASTTISDPDGSATGLTYQWIAVDSADNEDDIAGQTGSTLVLTSDLVRDEDLIGSRFKVRLTYTAGAFSGSTITTAATVLAFADRATMGSVTIDISGSDTSADVGETLTVDTTNLMDDDNDASSTALTFTYQWSRDDGTGTFVNIATGGTDAAFVTTESGAHRVTVTATDVLGVETEFAADVPVAAASSGGGSTDGPPPFFALADVPTADTLEGTNSPDTLNGASLSASQLIQGGGGTDRITSSGYGDIITGGYGADSITLSSANSNAANGGADSIVYRWKSASTNAEAIDGGDTITGFERGVDRFVFVDLDDTMEADPDNPGEMRLASAVTDLAGFLRYFKGADNVVNAGAGDDRGQFALTDFNTGTTTWGGILIEFYLAGTVDGRDASTGAGSSLRIDFSERLTLTDVATIFSVNPNPAGIGSVVNLQGTTHELTGLDSYERLTSLLGSTDDFEAIGFATSSEDTQAVLNPAYDSSNPSAAPEFLVEYENFIDTPTVGFDIL